MHFSEFVTPLRLDLICVAFLPSPPSNVAMPLSAVAGTMPFFTLSVAAQGAFRLHDFF